MKPITIAQLCQRSSQGFVLAEVLVVSVIVAILAAVAIPVYTGYVTSQRGDAAKNIAGSAAAAANIYYRRTGALPVCDATTCVAMLNLFLSDPANYSVSITGRTVTVTDLYHSGISKTANF